jgi:hypothetical protein
MASQFVGSAETLATAGKLAGMRLLSRVCSNVSCLMFKSVEGSVAQRTLVRAREVLAFIGIKLRSSNSGHGADDSSHGVVWLRSGGCLGMRDVDVCRIWGRRGRVGRK